MNADQFRGLQPSPRHVEHVEARRPDSGRSVAGGLERIIAKAALTKAFWLLCQSEAAQTGAAIDPTSLEAPSGTSDRRMGGVRREQVSAGENHQRPPASLLDLLYRSLPLHPVCNLNAQPSH